MFGQAIVTAETILAIMRQMRMRKISWRMTCCYYPTWWQSHSARPHYTLLEKLDVFSLCSSRATYHSHPRHSSFSRTAPATPTVRRVSSSGQPSVCVCLTVSINLSLHTRKFWNLIPFMYSCKEFTTENFQNDTRGEEKKKRTYTTLCKRNHKNGSLKRKFTTCLQRGMYEGWILNAWNWEW
jgi:hypothetical protein